MPNTAAQTETQTQPDFDGLASVLASAANRTPKQISASFWMNECGTMGCIIGWFCVDHPDDDLQLDRGFAGVKMKGCFAYDNHIHIARRFRITEQEAYSLFVAGPLSKDRASGLKQFIAQKCAEMAGAK